MGKKSAGRKPTTHYHLAINDLTTAGWRMQKRRAGSKRKPGSILVKDGAHKFVSFKGDVSETELEEDDGDN